MTRVGWLGGSFDPVHAGHLHIARGAADRLDLDRVLLVPAARPPHKRDRELAPGTDRMALLEIACADDPRLVPEDIELRRDGVSYTYDTIVALRERLTPDVRLFAIIGADTLADLPNWYRIGELAKLVTFCPVTRPGWELDVDGLADVLDVEARARIRDHALPLEPHPASSTGIRAALAEARRPPGVPDAVFDAIRERGLYGFSPGSGSGSSSDRSGGTASTP